MGSEGEQNQEAPLLKSYESSDRRFERTGNTWTAMAHILTAVIGAGVLAMTWSTAQLGWIAGPVTIVIFGVVTIVSANLLCDCYRALDPENGPTRNPSFLDAARLYLGEKKQLICGVIVEESLYGGGIAYTITAAASLRAIQKSNCFHREGHQAPCEYGETFYILLFGSIQIVVSQIPDFHNMAWLSTFAACMSFSYSIIGFALGFAKVIDNGKIKGSIGGVPAGSMAQKLQLAFQGLGDIFFAYPFSVILLEVQDTLKSPPPENQTMKKASLFAILITASFYLCCGCIGYAAFGNDAPGNLLTGFGFYEPYWLVDFANVCIVLQLVGGYQVYSQPVFAFVEKWFTGKFPDSGFVNKSYAFKLPWLPVFRLSPFRLCFRTAYVMSTTGIAAIFPYFNQVLGVLGPLNFWPLSIYFPMEMYFVQKKIGAWTRKWIVLQIFNIACFLVSSGALVASMVGLVREKLS